MDSGKPGERPNATVRPSGETAGSAVKGKFLVGDVNLRVSPVSVDISFRPPVYVTIHLPSGNQEKKARPKNMEK